MNFKKPSAKSLVLMALLSGSLSACGFTNYKTPAGAPGSTTGGSTATNPGGGGGGGTTSGTATFSSISSQILQPKCVGCHSNFSTYSGVMGSVTAGNPSGSTLYTMVQSGSMPQGGPALTTDEVNLIGTWIQDGALNN